MGLFRSTPRVCPATAANEPHTDKNHTKGGFAQIPRPAFRLDLLHDEMRACAAQDVGIWVSSAPRTEIIINQKVICLFSPVWAFNLLMETQLSGCAITQ